MKVLFLFLLTTVFLISVKAQYKSWYLYPDQRHGLSQDITALRISAKEHDLSKNAPCNLYGKGVHVENIIGDTTYSVTILYNVCGSDTTNIEVLVVRNSGTSQEIMGVLWGQNHKTISYQGRKDFVEAESLVLEIRAILQKLIG